MKVCNKCGVEKPFTKEYFYTENRNVSGLSGMCKECRAKTKKEWKENNKERFTLYHKKHYDNNREKCGMNIRKYKARKRSLVHTLTYEQWEETLKHFDDSCAYCGEIGRMDQEHFVPVSRNGEYTKNNIIPACSRCNNSKSNKNFEEWYLMQDFYDEDRKNKILDFLSE